MNRESSGDKVTVLIVEDEPLILDMISQELTDQGFAVLQAETGRCPPARHSQAPSCRWCHWLPKVAGAY